MRPTDLSCTDNLESEEIASSEVDMIVAMMSALSDVVFDIDITQSGDRGLGGSSVFNNRIASNRIARLDRRPLPMRLDEMRLDTM